MTPDADEITIGFRGFWPAFDPFAFFIPFVANALGHPLRPQRSGGPLDLEIVSVFPEGKPPGPLGTLVGRYRHRLPARWRADLGNGARPSDLARVSIWYSGENIRPPVGRWDATWSFDLDPLGGTNAYLPVWMIGMDFSWSVPAHGATPPQTSSLTDSNFLGRRLRSEELLRERAGDAGRRSKFCCAFINNPEPIRMHAIEALKAVGDVDVFGRVSGRPVVDKASVARDYQFVLSFENDVYPGYVTEKPFEAWATGAVPIWRGIDPAGYLNPAAVVNQLDYRDLAEMAAAVAQMRRDGPALTKISSLPILSRPPQLDAIAGQLRDLVLA